MERDLLVKAELRIQNSEGRIQKQDLILKILFIFRNLFNPSPWAGTNYT